MIGDLEVLEPLMAAATKHEDGKAGVCKVDSVCACFPSHHN